MKARFIFNLSLFGFKNSFFKSSSKMKNLTAVGFEPTPVKTGALNQRLRPLGHAIHIILNKKKLFNFIR